MSLSSCGWMLLHSFAHPADWLALQRGHTYGSAKRDIDLVNTDYVERAAGAHATSRVHQVTPVRQSLGSTKLELAQQGAPPTFPCAL